MATPYEVLGVSPRASEAEIKKAFRRLALREHPDKGGDGERFKKINEAYAIVGDPEKRRAYDRGGVVHGLEPGVDEFDLFSRFFGGQGRDFFSDDDPFFPPGAAFFAGRSSRRGNNSPFGQSSHASPFDDNEDLFNHDPFFGGGGGFGVSGFGARRGGFASSSSSFSSSTTSFGGGAGGFSSTSVSTTTLIKDGKRVTRTTKTVRHPDGRVETSTREDGGDVRGATSSRERLPNASASAYGGDARRPRLASDRRRPFSDFGRLAF